MSLQITYEHSSHLILLDIAELLPPFTYKKHILQRLSVHLNSPFGCIKLLVLVLNLGLDKKQGNSLVAFEQELYCYF